MNSVTGTVGKVWVTDKKGKIGSQNTTYNIGYGCLLWRVGGGWVRYFEISGKTVPPVK